MKNKSSLRAAQVPDQSILVGLIGEGIQASRTPRLHEQEAAELGLRCCYRLLDTKERDLGSEALPRLLDAAQLLGFAGVNITHPFKQAVIPLLDELSDEAAAIGSVNTVVFSAGRRSGHNTDWWGFAESFRRGCTDVSRNQVVLLGAGGAGAAVAYAAFRLGVQHLDIYDVDQARATTLAQRLCARSGNARAAPVDNIAAAVARADGLINATPVGMLSYPGLPLPTALLRPDLWVAEVVYFPLETELLRLARTLGCHTLDGGGMAVFQAVAAFRLFTGIVPDSERMLRHFIRMGG